MIRKSTANVCNQSAKLISLATTISTDLAVGINICKNVLFSNLKNYESSTQRETSGQVIVIVFFVYYYNKILVDYLASDNFCSSSKVPVSSINE